MAHDIEQFTDGTAGIVSARQKMWHGLGTVVDQDGLTAAEGMKYAKLGNWDVRKVKVFAEVVRTVITDDGVTRTTELIEVPDFYATIRDNPVVDGQVDPLGIVGNDWTAVQNETLCDLADAIVREGGAHFQTMGSLNGGRRVFITMNLPKRMVVGGVDGHELYLVLTNAHDGTASLQGMVTPIRVVCRNTLSWAMNGCPNMWTIRHTNAIARAAADARRTLDLSFRYSERFEAEAERMINADLSEGGFRRIASDLIRPVKAGITDRMRKADGVKLDAVTALFSDAATQANCRGTRWAGFQAVTEWKEHFSLVRHGDRSREIARAERAMAGGLSDFQGEAFKAFAVPA